MSLYRLLRFLDYRIRSVSRHGVHSPFVYAFMDHVPYSSDPGTFLKNLEAYFGSGNVFLKGLSGTDQDAHAETGNDQTVVVIFTDIHACKSNSRNWQRLHTSPAVMLSVDLFHYGVLCFSKNFREKQHFRIRLPHR